jgi:hypothetical protein
MRTYLKEKIGNPELFTGRKRELTFYLNWIERIKQESSLSSAILSRRKTGKTIEKELGVIPFDDQASSFRGDSLDFWCPGTIMFSVNMFARRRS